MGTNAIMKRRTDTQAGAVDQKRGCTAVPARAFIGLMMLVMPLMAYATITFTLAGIDGVAYTPGMPVAFNTVKTATANIAGPSTVPITLNILDQAGTPVRASVLKTAYIAGLTTTPGVFAADIAGLNQAGLPEGAYSLQFVLTDTSKFDWGTQAFASVSFVFPVTNSTSGATGTACPTPDCTASAATLTAGWHLLGNSGDSSMFVTAFNDPVIVTVWRWHTLLAQWELYAPSMPSGGCAYAQSKGYLCLTVIPPGSGYWVNLSASMPSPQYHGAVAKSAVTSSLAPGWNLVSIADGIRASELTSQIGNASVATIWAWSNAESKWFFHTPALSGADLSSYVGGKGYLDFNDTDKRLGVGVGFWLNKL